MLVPFGLAAPLLAPCPLPQLEDPALLFTLEGLGPEEGFGGALVPTQDLDGDGRADWGVSTGLGSLGRFQVLSSADRSVLLDVTADRLGFRSVQVGDATADGIGELLTFDVEGTTGRQSLVDPTNGALVLELMPVSGNFDVGLRPWFGRGPDVDLDGQADFWLRTRTGGSGATTYFEVRSGAAPAQVLYRLTINLSGDNGAFEGVDLLTDVDGDGVEEWLVGDDVIVQSSPNLQRGRIRVLSGATGALLLEVRGDDTSNDFGRIVRNVGDLNGDGREDLAAYVRRAGNTVEVFSGADGARLFTLEDPITNPVSGGGTDFGDVMAGLGDVDGDGIGDLCVGAPGGNEFVSSGGSAFVYSGASGDLIAATRGLEIRQDMGTVVFGPGDLDGDGRADWLVGSPMTGNFDPSFGMIEAYGLPDRDVLLDFETADDFATPLVNGAALDTLERFGRVVRISSSGPGQVGPAAYDSSPTGPNAADPDLLVGRGNILILQEDAAQTVPGIYDVPDDAATGGTLRLELIQAVRPRSLVLVDVDPLPPVEDVIVRLLDGAGRARTYTVPGGFTSDGELDPERATRSLRLDTLSDQPGATATATAAEETDFDPARVNVIEVVFTGSGAVDDLRLSPGDPTPVDASRLIRRIDAPGGSGLQFASDVVALGDVDGDGTGELVIGSGPLSAAEPFGRAGVYRGSDGGLLSQVFGPANPQGNGTFGAALAALGDVDGDGAPEFVAGAFRDQATATGPRGFVTLHDGLTCAEEDLLEAAGDTNFGGALASLADLDGDGVRDFAVGANQAAAGVGEVRLYSGATRALLRVIPGAPTLVGFGSTLVGVGDVDGDGFEDLGGSTDLGFFGSGVAAFRVHSGATGALLYERRGATSSAVPGYRSAPMGDLDGDGLADFALVTLDVGAGTEAALTVVSGGTGAVLFELLPQVTTSGRVAGGCASPGDLDGDGVRDLVYHGREPDQGPVPGRTFVAALSGADFRELFRRFYGVPFQGGAFVEDVDAAGDVDGDGFGDIAVTVFDTAAQSTHVEVLGYIRRPASVVCVGEPNSGGSGTRLRIAGSTSVAANDLTLEVQNLPVGSFSVVAVSEGLGRPPIVSDGVLCLDAATTLRLPGIHGGATIVGVPVDLTALPTVGAPGFTAAAMAGETRYFQAWYRDNGGVTGSNLSDALAVTFVD